MAPAPSADTHTAETAQDGLVVVGGGPAGLAAARAYREHDGRGPVTLLTPEPDAPYFRPSLSKELLRGEQDEGDLPLVEDDWWDAHGVTLRTDTRVVALDPAARRVRTEAGEEIAYASCVLATGSTAIRPEVPGADDERVVALRSLRTGVALRERVREARSAVVVGSGFVGCEAAVSLALAGLRVTLVTDEEQPHAARLGTAVGQRIADWLRGHGVDVRTGAAAEAVEEARRVHASGAVHEGDVVLIGAGVAPDVALAADAGLTIEDGRVVVSAAMRTSADGVLAAGDAVLAQNPAAGRRLAVAHWGEADAMGEVAGATAAGTPESWDAVPGFWSVLGDRVLKHLAWGDGFDEVRFVEHAAGEGFTAWQGAGGVVVGALCHEADGDYERAPGLIRRGAPLDEVAR